MTVALTELCVINITPRVHFMTGKAYCLSLFFKATLSHFMLKKSSSVWRCQSFAMFGSSVRCIQL